MNQVGQTVLDVTPGNCDVNIDLAYGVDKANSWGTELFASIHFNKAYDSYNGAIGTEGWIYGTGGKAEPVAHRVVDKISSATGLINRGVKVSTGLYELRKTNMPAMIIEVCFVEASEDVRIYKEKGADFIGKCIAEAIINNSINAAPVVAAPQQSSNNNVKSEGDYMSKRYQNGKTPEPVYADEKLTIKVGSLDPFEVCEAIADINNKIVVLYNTPNGKKAGFVGYRGGVYFS
ncbi:N-acetylmuramoyl-L-alanine amidase [Clostridium yunnanense]|uniref:N-acetylmuramoyl-L-alanine amidase n=1 Tax=Clostridium yunnanense TaxID=2800325 RepID=UPI001FAD41BD|nr:N-acetylmuramoyl-L-alanine amidase [Clostridium yunnanense]